MSEVVSEHGDAGPRCLVIHDDESGYAPCLKCSCGEWVRPHEWDAHVALGEEVGMSERLELRDQ